MIYVILQHYTIEGCYLEEDLLGATADLNLAEQIATNHLDGNEDSELLAIVIYSIAENGTDRETVKTYYHDESEAKRYGF